MLELQIAVLALLLVLSSFFSSVETALMSVSNIKVRSLVRQKKRGSEALQRIKTNPERLLITILVGNNVVNIGSAALATSITTEMFGDLGVGIATGVMTLLILVFGEIAPKSYAAQNSVSMSLKVARPLELLTKAIFPIVRFLEGLTNIMMRLFGSRKGDRLSEEELKTIVSMGAEQGLIRKQIARMMESLIEFEKTGAREIMTPKSEMEILEGSKTVGEVLDFVVKSPYSRYPVFKGDKDKIVGIVDVDQILSVVRSGKLKRKVSSIMTKPRFIPESKETLSLISEFERQKFPMAIVVDEYGHVMGLVTMDDVLEEIVGDIFDKSKKSHSFIKVIGPKEFLVDGRASIEVLDDYVDLGVEEKDFDTIAGLVLKKLGRIPRSGEELRMGSFKIRVEKVSEKHIRRVRIIKK